MACVIDLNLICVLHLYCIAMIHLKANVFEHGWLAFTMGWAARKGKHFNAAFLAYDCKGKWLKTLVSLLFRVLTVLAGGAGFMIHLLFSVQYLVGALCSMSLSISRALYDVN